MRLFRPSAAVAALALAVVLASAGPARAVAVSVGTGTALAGQTIDIDVSTASLTGLNVKSLQFNIAYNPSVVTPTAIIESGLLTGNAGWNNAQFGTTIFNVNSATLHVSDAGTTALTGAGSMLRMRFVINPALINGSSTGLTLSNFVFNEGTPTVTMTNGSITVGVTPRITVSPDVGEIVRTQTLQFTVSGNVTLPVQWFTTNNAIATINSAGLLTGVAPGSVQVFAVDNAGVRDTTSAILVRGMGLTAGVVSVIQGQQAQVPITATSLTGLGIRAGQFTLSYNQNVGIPTGVTTPAGTLLNGWAAPTLGVGSGNCTVDFAGSSDLSGAGVLCYVTFQTNLVTSGSTTLTLSNALFNEVLPAKTTNGTLTAQALPTIIVNPDQVTLLAGQTQQMTLSGTPTPPISWSVLDPTIASINSAGLLTAIKGGVTQVRAQDAVGAVDLNTSVRVYDFKATVGTVTGRPGTTVHVPITADRFVGGLGIWSVQYILSWSGAYFANVHSSLASLIGNTWGSGSIVDGTNVPGTNIHVASGGATTLPATSKDIAAVDIDIRADAPASVDVPLSLTSFVMNEGSPSAQTVNGVVHIRNTTDVPTPGSSVLALSAAEPNPVRSQSRVHFSLPKAADVRLDVLGVDGRHIRSLVSGATDAGEHDVVWDGRDDAGRLVSPGLYFDRLIWQGQTLARRMVVSR